MLNTVKQALRITHTKLDTNIQMTINAAQAELVRVGVNDAMVYGIKSGQTTVYNPLIIEAVCTYCQMNYTDDEKRREMYAKSFETIADALRKSRGYSEVENV